MKKYSILLLLVSCLLYITSCNKNTGNVACDGSKPTYTSDIKAIIDANCTSSGCHGTGSYNGDYTSYAGIKGALTSGSFASQVIANRTMPKGGELSQAELVSIKCWMENGYAE